MNAAIFISHITVFTKILTGTIVTVISIYWAADQHISMISGGSGHNEDWSNDCKSAI